MRPAQLQLQQNKFLALLTLLSSEDSPEGSKASSDNAKPSMKVSLMARGKGNKVRFFQLPSLNPRLVSTLATCSAGAEDGLHRGVGVARGVEEGA